MNSVSVDLLHCQCQSGGKWGFFLMLQKEKTHFSGRKFVILSTKSLLCLTFRNFILYRHCSMTTRETGHTFPDDRNLLKSFFYRRSEWSVRIIRIYCTVQFAHHRGTAAMYDYVCDGESDRPRYISSHEIWPLILFLSAKHVGLYVSGTFIVIRAFGTVTSDGSSVV
jgi:hypothetical protein